MTSRAQQVLIWVVLVLIIAAAVAIQYSGRFTHQGATSGGPEGPFRIDRSTPACVTQTDLGEIRQVYLTVEGSGLKEALDQYLRSGRCISLYKGDVVYRESSGGSLMKVRPLGQSQIYWTVAAAVDINHVVSSKAAGDRDAGTPASSHVPAASEPTPPARQP